MQKTARTFVFLVCVLPITSVLVTIATADEQLAELPVCSKRNLWDSPPSNRPCFQGFSTTQACDLQQDASFRVSQRHTYSNRGLQDQSRLLAQRSLMPSIATIGDLIWEEMSVVFNASAMASSITAQFYINITSLASRERWLATAVHVFIISCGVLKLMFEVVAAERPISWHAVQDFILEFARMMNHVTKSVVMASYTAVLLTAIASYRVTFWIVENALHQELVTGPTI